MTRSSTMNVTSSMQSASRETTAHLRRPDCPLERARLSRIITEHFAGVGRALRRLGVRDADVDDRTQRVFLTATRRLSEIRPGSEGAFLFAVALREASHQRRVYRRLSEVGEDAMADKSTGKLRPDDVVCRDQMLAFLEAALSDLDAELKLTFTLFQIEEMPIKEIADVLGLPLGTVKSRLRRAREELCRRTLKDEKKRPPAPPTGSRV